MRNFLKLFALAAALVFIISPWSAYAKSVVTNTADQRFEAVDELSTSITVQPFTTLTTFVSGTYAAGNTVVLQREVGSPGSGAFQTVQTVTNGIANDRVVNSWVSGPNTESYRLIMTATGTGAVSAFLTDAPVTSSPIYESNSTTVVNHQDFQTNNEEGSLTLLDAELWVTQEDNGDTGGAVAVYDASNREGGVVIVSVATDAAAVCFSYVTIANLGALVSDGGVFMEARISVDDDDGAAFVGISDAACVTDNEPLYTITANVTVAQATALTDSAVFGYDNGATGNQSAVTAWHALSAVTDVEGANAQGVPTRQIVVATYVVLRVELNAAGDAFWYFNGALVHAEPLAIGTTIELGPKLQVSGTGGDAITMTIDYVTFGWTRPAGPST